jgi:hypothetical protein
MRPREYQALENRLDEIESLYQDLAAGDTVSEGILDALIDATVKVAVASEAMIPTVMESARDGAAIIARMKALIAIVREHQEGVDTLLQNHARNLIFCAALTIMQCAPSLYRGPARDRWQS